MSKTLASIRRFNCVGEIGEWDCEAVLDRITELEAVEKMARQVVIQYRDGDPMILDGMHPSIDNLRLALGMSAVPNEP